MSDSVRPHRRQPTSLPRPWDSPGKNTGVGCHFLLQCMKVKSESEVAQLCLTLATPWTAAYQASQSMGSSRQKYWSGVPLPFLKSQHSSSVVSNSMRPSRRQPTRLPRPWNSSVKNTGVGFHILLQCMKLKSESEVTQLCLTLATPWTAAHQAPPSMGFSRQEYWSGVPLPSPVLAQKVPIFKI